MLDFPLEYALVVFPGNQFSGEIVPELLDLAERDIVRLRGYCLHPERRRRQHPHD